MNDETETTSCPKNDIDLSFYKHLLIAYFLSNIFAKNYQNIASRMSKQHSKTKYSDIFETQCKYKHGERKINTCKGAG